MLDTFSATNSSKKKDNMIEIPFLISRSTVPDITPRWQHQLGNPPPMENKPNIKKVLPINSGLYTHEIH